VEDRSPLAADGPSSSKYVFNEVFDHKPTKSGGTRLICPLNAPKTLKLTEQLLLAHPLVCLVYFVGQTPLFSGRLGSRPPPSYGSLETVVPWPRLGPNFNPRS
jgi:hypothetical protein